MTKKEKIEQQEPIPVVEDKKALFVPVTLGGMNRCPYSGAWVAPASSSQVHAQKAMIKETSKGALDEIWTEIEKLKKQVAELQGKHK